MRWGGKSRVDPVFGSQYSKDILRRAFALSHFDQRPDDGAYHAVQETICADDEIHGPVSI